MEDLKRYYYKGPVYEFGVKIKDIKDPIVTDASTEGRAISNIKFAIKKSLGLRVNDVIEINKDRLFYDEIMDEDNSVNVKYCDNCGTQLNPLDECPVCDYGENDLLSDD